MNQKISQKDLESLKSLSREIGMYEAEIGRMEVKKIAFIAKINSLRSDLAKINERLAKKYGEDAIIAPNGEVIKNPEGSLQKVDESEG